MCINKNNNSFQNFFEFIMQLFNERWNLQTKERLSCVILYEDDGRIFSPLRLLVSNMPDCWQVWQADSIPLCIPSWRKLHRKMLRALEIILERCEGLKLRLEDVKVTTCVCLSRYNNFLTILWTGVRNWTCAHQYILKFGQLPTLCQPKCQAWVLKFTQLWCNTFILQRCSFRRFIIPHQLSLVSAEISFITLVNREAHDKGIATTEIILFQPSATTNSRWCSSRRKGRFFWRKTETLSWTSRSSSCFWFASLPSRLAISTAAQMVSFVSPPELTMYPVDVSEVSLSSFFSFFCRAFVRITMLYRRWKNGGGRSRTSRPQFIVSRFCHTSSRSKAKQFPHVQLKLLFLKSNLHSERKEIDATPPGTTALTVWLASSPVQTTTGYAVSTRISDRLYHIWSVLLRGILWRLYCAPFVHGVSYLYDGALRYGLTTVQNPSPLVWSVSNRFL